MFVLRKKHFDGAAHGTFVRIGEKVDELYGAEFVTITPSGLEELKAGKVLNFWVNAEYSIFLKLGKEQEAKEDVCR